MAFARRRASERFNLSLMPLLYRADTDSFAHQRHKLGLGSSAAVTVLAVASVVAENGLDLTNTRVRERLWEAAFAIHNEFQNATGSGGDLAASLFGGLSVVTPRGNGQAPAISEAALENDVHLSFVYTGASSSTSELVRLVRDFKQRHPGRYSECIEIMREISTRTTAEPVLGFDVLRTAFSDYGECMGRLGRLSNAPIITDDIRGLMQSADTCGGAAKPSGAGGGDLVVAVCQRP